MSRLILRNGVSIVNTLLRRSIPSVSVVPKVCLLHTTSTKWMPVPKITEEPGKVRLGLIPEEWFELMYKKTGVTGPYVLGVGLISFLLSKELYILGPETIHAAVAFSVIIYCVRRFDPMYAYYMDKELEKAKKEAYAMKNVYVENCTSAIESEEQQQWRLQGLNYLFEAQRENVALQLEVEYRERLQKVTNAVHSRMDYHVELDSLSRRMEQKQMVSWIERNVLKSITPQQDTEVVNECITNLKKMATTA